MKNINLQPALLCKDLAIILQGLSLTRARRYQARCFELGAGIHDKKSPNPQNLGSLTHGLARFVGPVPGIHYIYYNEYSN